MVTTNEWKYNPHMNIYQLELDDTLLIMTFHKKQGKFRYFV